MEGRTTTITTRTKWNEEGFPKVTTPQLNIVDLITVINSLTRTIEQKHKAFYTWLKNLHRKHYTWKHNKTLLSLISPFNCFTFSYLSLRFAWKFIVFLWNWSFLIALYFPKTRIRILIGIRTRIRNWSRMWWEWFKIWLQKLLLDLIRQIRITRLTCAQIVRWTITITLKKKKRENVCSTFCTVNLYTNKQDWHVQWLQI